MAFAYGWLGRLIIRTPMDAAVVQFLKDSEEKERFNEFVRWVFLRKDLEHPCILPTLGGNWPHQVEVEDANGRAVIRTVPRILDKSRGVQR